MAGQNNVPAQKVFLGRKWMQRRQMFRLRCHGFEQTSVLGLTKDIAIGAGGFGFNFWADSLPSFSLVVDRTDYRC